MLTMASTGAGLGCATQGRTWTWDVQGLYCVPVHANKVVWVRQRTETYGARVRRSCSAAVHLRRRKGAWPFQRRPLSTYLGYPIAYFSITGEMNTPDYSDRARKRTDGWVDGGMDASRWPPLSLHSSPRRRARASWSGLQSFSSPPVPTCCKHCRLGSVMREVAMK